MTAPAYVAAESIADALRHLGNPATRLLAGGQTLIAALHRGEGRCETLIDIGRLGELRGVAARDDGLHIGAAVTLTELLRSDAISGFPVVARAVREIANDVVRNRATLGGCVALADSNGEVPLLLLGLEGDVEIATAKGRAWKPAARYFRDGLGRGELITGIRLPRREAAFREFRLRPSAGRSLVSVLLRRASGGWALTVGGLSALPDTLAIGEPFDASAHEAMEALQPTLPSIAPPAYLKRVALALAAQAHAELLGEEA